MEKNKKTTKTENNKDKLVEMTEAILTLQTELSTLKETNEKLKLIIQEANDSYTLKINTKANEAKEILNIKIKENEEKFNKELTHIKKYMLADKMQDFIGVISQFDQAVTVISDDQKINNFLTGFKMFSMLFKNELTNLGIMEIDTKIGDEFNPAFMDAVDIENNPIQKDNHVERIITKGYKLHDRVITPVKVVVSKKQLK